MLKATTVQDLQEDLWFEGHGALPAVKFSTTDPDTPALTCPTTPRNHSQTKGIDLADLHLQFPQQLTLLPSKQSEPATGEASLATRDDATGLQTIYNQTLFSKSFVGLSPGQMRMAMISMNDLFYGEREAVQILKDENREILDIIHRYNYFYTEPPPLSDVDVSTESDSEDEDVESNWREIESSLQDAANGRKDGNEPGKSPGQPEQDAKVALRVPMCCPECEETVTVALQNVAGVEDVVTFLLEEMVTVTGTARPGDLLLACRDLKLFRKTQLWRDDSD